MRPYGFMKLEQEKTLTDSLPGIALSIYRPSTVYGPRIQHARRGLINNLINDGLRGRPTVLDAHTMSLRDYVYTDDIGAFVAKRIRFPSLARETARILFLVSSRCASIFEVVRTIERVLHLKLRYRLDQSFGNHSNITFSHSLSPNGWSPTPLEVGVRQFVAGRHARLPVPLGR
jgi:nucleoside-diphosphate-sugar epimerase